MKIASVPWRCGQSWANSGPADSVPGTSGQGRVSVEDLHARVVADHVGDDVAGFGRDRGAGHVRDHAAGADRGEGRAEQRPLQLGQGREVGLGLPPAGLGTAAERAEPRAGGVDQHPVEAAVGPGRPGAVGDDDLGRGAVAAARDSVSLTRAARCGWSSAAIRLACGARSWPGRAAAGTCRRGRRTGRASVRRRCRRAASGGGGRGCQRGVGQRDGSQLAGFVLDGGLAGGDQIGRVAGVQGEGVGDQRPGSASAGITWSRSGPPGRVAMVTLGRVLPSARAASSSASAASSRASR